MSQGPVEVTMASRSPMARLHHMIRSPVTPVGHRGTTLRERIRRTRDLPAVTMARRVVTITRQMGRIATRWMVQEEEEEEGATVLPLDR